MVQTVVIDSNKPDLSLLRGCGQKLLDGNVAIFPTETFYGFGTSAFNERAVNRICELKGRDAHKPIPLIAKSRTVVETLADIPRTLGPLLEHFWPGPLTVALRPKRSLPAPILGGLGTVGVRISSHPVARALVDDVELLTATSANLAGHAPAQWPKDIAPELLQGTDIVVDGGACKGGAPSTVIEAQGNRLVVHRVGAIAISALEEVCGTKVFVVGSL